MIRRADIEDIPRIMDLLGQVDMVHFRSRPDIFKPNTTKYTEQELCAIMADDNTPIYIYDDGDVKGYVFAQVLEMKNDRLLQDRKTLYIDDLCVDEAARGKHIGSQLFEFIRDYAQSIGCQAITLNVWEGNDTAQAFYLQRGMRAQKTYMELKV